jgi:hypothetical protein
LNRHPNGTRIVRHAITYCPELPNTEDHHSSCSWVRLARPRLIGPLGRFPSRTVTPNGSLAAILFGGR